MKYATLLTLLFCISSLQAQLSYLEKATVAEHLQAVNNEWDSQKFAKFDASETISFASESDRIQFHLEQTIRLINSKNELTYTADQLEARRHQMDVLADYALAKKFPINTKHKVRQPYFVDDFGTACAVGYLALNSGASALVEKIKQKNNYAYIDEMNYPELNSWAGNNGLSMDELALIQPAYSPSPTQWHSMGDGSGIDGIVHDMVEFNSELIIVGAFNAIHGKAAKNIVRWNGEAFLNFDVDIEGEIFVTLRYLAGGQNLMIGGDFLLNGVRANIANYHDGEWTILQNGEMDGAVHTLIHAGNDYIVAGGDFQKIDGQDMPYIAAFQDGEWTQTPESYQSVQSESGAFSVSGPVSDLDIYGDFNGSFLLISGAYEEIQTRAEVSEPMYSKNMAFWNIQESKWESTFDGDYCAIGAAGIVDGKIYFGGDVECDEGVNQFAAGLYSTRMLDPQGDGQIHDIYSNFGNTFMIGGIAVSEDYIIVEYRYGMFVLKGNLNAALFNNTVHCMTYYAGNYYVAGDYTTINEEEFTNLAYSTLEKANSVNEQITQDDLKIYAAAGRVYCETTTLIDEMDLRIYDAGGRMVTNTVFENVLGSREYAPQVPLQGIYFYEVQTEEGRQSGKLFLENAR